MYGLRPSARPLRHCSPDSQTGRQRPLPRHGQVRAAQQPGAARSLGDTGLRGSGWQRAGAPLAPPLHLLSPGPESPALAGRRTREVTPGCHLPARTPRLGQRRCRLPVSSEQVTRGLAEARSLAQPCQQREPQRRSVDRQSDEGTGYPGA